MYLIYLNTRLILHALHGSCNCYNKISIVTVDTDVIVICLYHFHSFNLQELWVKFGVGKNRRYFPIHQKASLMKCEEVCKGLPFWYSLTGCDTVSMFAGRGKKSAWNTWESFLAIIKTFIRFGNFYY